MDYFFKLKFQFILSEFCLCLAQSWLRQSDQVPHRVTSPKWGCVCASCYVVCWSVDLLWLL